MYISLYIYTSQIIVWRSHQIYPILEIKNNDIWDLNFEIWEYEPKRTAAARSPKPQKRY